VGLVGKPSAGKSSFYNAATQACFSKDGRRMAAVAAHPFTTIEPNVGPGFYPGPADNDTDCSRGALYGRDSLGRRLLPILIKDVAGLVPGAYKGRGKGNQFLADLCDADVLIHVVDATGKSDKDGNVIHIARLAKSSGPADPSGSSCTDDDNHGLSSPSEDCKWVREELHRWIHGNVKVKWASVTRKSKDKHIDRIVALFSGYQGSKSYTYRALQRSGITLNMLGSLTALDLHRLVAHFLSIRFPTLLALNKVDDFDDLTVGKKVIQTCQEEAYMRGELAVPVCARAENWLQLKEACRIKRDIGGQLEGDEITLDNMNLSESASNSIGLVSESLEDDPGQSSNTAASSTRIVLPPVGSAVWLQNEAVVQRALSGFPLTGTGVSEALARAVSLNAPLLCYPVCDLDSEMPVGWTPGETPDKGIAGRYNAFHSEIFSRRSEYETT
jgi:ribosome-binding ATPase YchF (GTP1/OBG family)